MAIHHRLQFCPLKRNKSQYQFSIHVIHSVIIYGTSFLSSFSPPPCLPDYHGHDLHRLLSLFRQYTARMCSHPSPIGPALSTFPLPTKKTISLHHDLVHIHQKFLYYTPFNLCVDMLGFKLETRKDGSVENKTRPIYLDLQACVISSLSSFF